jgi:hypothetical protein
MNLPLATEQQRAMTSPLLEKVLARGLSWPIDLERRAVARGCDYYGRDLGPRIPPLGEVLTKLIRGYGEQDMADVEFILRHDRMTEP